MKPKDKYCKPNLSVEMYQSAEDVLTSSGKDNTGLEDNNTDDNIP